MLGVKVRLDASVLVMFALVVGNLSFSVLPAWHPEWSAWLVGAVACAAAIAFLGSILLHELSHAIVARMSGIRVRGVRLLLFGGVADVDEPCSPGREALIAGVGPIVSIAIGLVFGVVAAVLAGHVDASEPGAAIRRMAPIPTLLTWLAPVNVLVGLFNLIPGFPLDGGRILRALIWGVTGDLHTATRWAARVGQGFGLLIIIAGLAMVVGLELPLLGGGLIQGLWFVFIGWFLNAAAASTYDELVLRELLADVDVAGVMRRLPARVPLSAGVSALIDRAFRVHRHALALAVDELDRPFGIVRAADVRRLDSDALLGLRVSDVAIPLASFPKVRARAPAFEALAELNRRSVEELAVVDSGRLLGIVRHADIARFVEAAAASSVGARRVAGSA